MKQAEARLRRMPENPRYQKEYRIRKQMYDQANTKVASGNETVNIRIGATWTHALVPTQPQATADVLWEVIKVSSNDTLGKRTSAKLRLEEMLIP